MSDRKQAQVHIMMLRQRTGSGGIRHTITFTGLQDFTAVNDTLVYSSQQMDTEEVVRSGIVNAITMGLVQYVSKTPLAEDLTIPGWMVRNPKNACRLRAQSRRTVLPLTGKQASRSIQITVSAS